MWSRRAVLGAGIGATVSLGCRGIDGARGEHADGWIWSGAAEATSASVIARGLDLGTCRLRLVASSDEPLRLIDPVTRPSSGPVRFDLTGLEPNTRYAYACVDDQGATLLGSLRTLPSPGPASFKVCAGSCAQTGSSHPVFDTIREHDPAVFLHLGDLHYENIADDDPARFERAFDRVLSAPRQAELYRHTPVAYVWDDHDYGANNSDRTSPSRNTVREIYRSHVPSYALEEERGAIYHAFTIGRVRFLMTDGRSERTPPKSPHRYRTMLGKKQKAWLKRELLESKGRYPLVVWVSSVGWIGREVDGDSWPGYPAERAELALFLVEHGIKNVLMLSGDAHMLAIDDGTNNRYTQYGGPNFPVFHVAALDQTGSDKGGPYSHGVDVGGGHFGVIEVEDRVHTVSVTLRGKDDKDETLIEHRFTVPG